MSKFIVIEGLDGTGKTTAAKMLAGRLALDVNNNVLKTHEPNENYSFGSKIRQVLKSNYFGGVDINTMFLINRSSHTEALIIPFLDFKADKESIVVSDRYYLSSLVYQSKPYSFFLDKGMIRTPDITFFLNTDVKVIQERIKKRGQPLEMFEKNFKETKEKYLKAISYLRDRCETIIEIDANGTTNEIVEQMLTYLK